MKKIDNTATPATPSDEKSKGNPTNFFKKVHLPRCYRRIGFFKWWMLFGIIMMILDRTIWPEIDTEIKGIYDLTTALVKMVNEFCLSAYPYFEKVVNWLTEVISNSYSWWTETGFELFRFGSEAALAIFIFAFALALTATIILALTSALKEEKVKNFFKDLFNFFKSKIATNTSTSDSASDNEETVDEVEVRGSLEIEDVTG